MKTKELMTYVKTVVAGALIQPKAMYDLGYRSGLERAVRIIEKEMKK